MGLKISLESKTEALSKYLNRGLGVVDFDFDKRGNIWVTSNSFN